MSSSGMGGASTTPAASDKTYPPCSATVADNCTEHGGGTRHAAGRSTKRRHH
jgi:hypothetical protein